MSSSSGEVCGVMAVWTQDDDGDFRTEGGDGLSGRSHGGDGEVLLEVRLEGRRLKNQVNFKLWLDRVHPAELHTYCGEKMKVFISLLFVDTAFCPQLRARAGKYINTVSYCDMRQDIVTDFGYRYIVIWPKFCLFLVEEASLR